MVPAFLAILLCGLLASWPSPPIQQPAEGSPGPASLPIGEEASTAPLSLDEIPPAPPAPDELRLDGPLVDPVIAEPERAGAPDRPAAPPAVTVSEPTWKQNAVAVAVAPGQPRIAIVIDDVGPAHDAALTAIALPAPLTLAFLPYADDLPALTAKAHQAGHELMIHMPMQPIDLAHNNPGPEALLVDLTPDEIRRRLEWALGRFDGYVGINNHMGSAFSTDVAGLTVVMQTLREHGLLFLDSRTIGNSKAEGIALSLGVPSTVRDVFLDNEEDSGAIRAQLAELERVARKRGAAIAIGHPHAQTLAVLREWLPDAKARGFVFVPISALVQVPDDNGRQLSAKPAEAEGLR